MKLISRKPAEARPSRMGPLAKLPVFLDLSGKRAVVAGGTAAAAWKAELLAAAGASVDVFAETLDAEMAALIARSEGTITQCARPWAIRLFFWRRRRAGRYRGRRASPILRLRSTRGGRARQRYRQAGVLSVPVRLDRQPLTGRDRHFHRRCGPDPRAGYTPPHRDAAARVLGGVGGFGIARCATQSWRVWPRVRRGANSGNAFPSAHFPRRHTPKNGNHSTHWFPRSLTTPTPARAA